MIGAVFAMQGFGQFAASMMTLIVVAAFRSALEPVKTPAACDGECQRSVDIMWRIVIGVGGVPGLFALYYRLTIPETPRYTFDVVHDLDQATANVYSWRSGGIGEGWTNPMRRVQIMQDVKRKYHSPQPTYTDLKAYYRKRRNALALFGTAGSWFFLDVAFYGLGLNSSTILSTIGYGGKENVYQSLYNAAVGNLILVCAGAIPGYWCTVATVDFLGRKTIQLSGFVILTILFAIIGFDFHHLSERSLLVLYVLCQFFFNFGKFSSLFGRLFFWILFSTSPKDSSHSATTFTSTHISCYQAPTPQPLLFPLSASRPVSGRQHTAFRLQLEKSVPSSHRSSSHPWPNGDTSLTLRLPLRGSITSCKYLPFSCSAASEHRS
jgi:PHS family inorganic phosphate transporter-like MFS transporter